MTLLSKLVFISSMSKNTPLHLFFCLRAMRLSLEQGISKYLLVILSNHCVVMKEQLLKIGNCYEIKLIKSSKRFVFIQIV
jgi:hypothetical protein